MANVLKNGWLHKRSSSVFPQWQRRLVDLQATARGKTLTLKANEDASRCRQFTISQVENSTANNIVVVHCGDGRKLRLRAKSKADCEEWLAACQGHVPSDPLPPPNLSLSLNSEPKDESRASVAGADSAGPHGMRELSQKPCPTVMPMGNDLEVKTFPQGKYVGEFAGGQRNGMGHFRYSNGNEYVGSWERDMKHGFGRFSWTNSNVYSGQWQQNKMWGHGCFQFSNGNVFIGTFVADNKNGIGKFTWSNGDTYEGCWAKDEMNGAGTTRYANGNVYTGEHMSNLKHGKGQMEWASGDKFDGEWRKGMIEGCGSFLYSDGGKYTGEWHQDRRHGQGSMLHANGDQYKGAWANDMRHGDGTCEYANSDTFVGSFVDNLRQGWGVYTAASMRVLNPDGKVEQLKGDQYSGNWLKDKKHGSGQYVWSDGDTYEGQWENDLRSGEGSCLYTNGDRYTGEWLNDKRHGWGRLVWADGNTYEGGWKNDNISPGTKGLLQSQGGAGAGASGRESRLASANASNNSSRDHSAANSPNSLSVPSAIGQKMSPMLSPTPEVDGLEDEADWGDIPDISMFGNWLNGITGQDKARDVLQPANTLPRPETVNGRSLLLF